MARVVKKRKEHMVINQSHKENNRQEEVGRDVHCGKSIVQSLCWMFLLVELDWAVCIN